MTTDSLKMAKYEPDDFELYYSMVKSDAVMKYITGKGLTRKEARGKFNAIIQINREENEIGYFKAYNGDGVHIGDGKLERYERNKSLLEIGYILREEFWGKGYGTLICEKMLTLANRTAPAMDVIGIIDPDNAASKRLLEKLHFKSCFVGIEDDLPTEKLKLARKY